MLVFGCEDWGCVVDVEGEVWIVVLMWLDGFGFGECVVL